MFGNSITLFRLLGFKVKADASWLLLVILLTWTLAASLFPLWHEGLSRTTYWLMGIVGSAGLFVSIVLHELSHSLVARREGMPIKGITLFIFGGVAEMDDEPPSARTEFLMAIAGPITSVILGLIFFGVERTANLGNWPIPVTAVFGYLGWVNLVLAAFNMVPAFPLDGGRVLRSALWHWKKNLRQATEIAAKIGAGFGLLLIILGVFTFLAGNLIAGIWWFMIGMFLRGASKMSHGQVLIRQMLQGEKVERFMQTELVGVNPSLSVEDLVEDYVYRYHHKIFPVMDGEKLVGCVTTRNIKALPRENWANNSVQRIMSDCSDRNTIAPEADAIEALRKMSKEGSSRLLVVKGEQLVGILTLKDMSKFLSLKLDLEFDEPGLAQTSQSQPA
jgi:Zn-dependent protease/predicted transcriptional regulator